MFAIGQRVICVDNRPKIRPRLYEDEEVLPELGRIYTVRELTPVDLARGADEVGVRLAEIINPELEYHCPSGDTIVDELAFRVSWFRPLRTTGIDVLRKALKRAPVRKPVKELAEAD